MPKPVTPQDLFSLWQKMVNPGAFPLQSLMFPVTDPEELDKKIAELETVEHWLKANLNMLQLSIKSLDFQRQMLRGGNKVKQAMAEAADSAQPETQPSEEAPNPAMWAWNLMQQAGLDAAGAMTKATSGQAKPAGEGRAKRGPKSRTKTR